MNLLSENIEHIQKDIIPLLVELYVCPNNKDNRRQSVEVVNGLAELITQSYRSKYLVYRRLIARLEPIVIVSMYKCQMRYTKLEYPVSPKSVTKHIKQLLWSYLNVCHDEATCDSYINGLLYIYEFTSVKGEYVC